MSSTEEIKRKISEFYRKYPDFDDENPEHLRAVQKLYHELISDYRYSDILEAIEELQKEAELAVKLAREKFYSKIWI